MPSKLWKKKKANKNYYEAHGNELRERAREKYVENKPAIQDSAKVYSKHAYSQSNSSRNAKKNASRKYYNDHKSQRQASFKQYLSAHKQERLASFKNYSTEHRAQIRASHRDYYRSNKAARKAYFSSYYSTHQQQIKAARQVYYRKNKDQKKSASRAHYLSNAKAVLRRARKYYAENRGRICSDRKKHYQLAEPKALVKHHYITEVTKKLLCGAKALKNLIEAFKSQHGEVTREMSKSTCTRAASSIAAARLIHQALQLRRYIAGRFLKAVRSITKMDISQQSDFGEGLHCSHSEPYYYESAYVHARPPLLSINEMGKCRVADEMSDESEEVSRTWKCSYKCKPLTEAEVDSILTLKSCFDEPMQELRKALDSCDQCPNNHYSKVLLTSDQDPDSDIVHYTSVKYIGHNLVCYSDSGCDSKLRILRAASTHYPALRSLLRQVYCAIDSHKCVADLDEALSSGDFAYLMRVNDIDSFSVLLSNEIQTSHESADCELTKCVLRRPDLEKHIQTTYAKTIALYKKDLEDFPQNPCCSCNMLLQQKQGCDVTFSDDVGRIWPELKQLILKEDPQADKKTLFMCYYCKSRLRSNEMPPRSVLNNLQVVPIPKELQKLDCLSKQLIQRAKAFQTVVKLGAYTKKVPTYNSLKACKGSVFYLPLPLAKTMETLQQVEGSLADPELFMIVNNKPTKKNVVWRSMIDINQVKAAINKLRTINFLYRDITDESVDSVAKEVIQVVSKTSSTMLEKASSSDIAGLQSYTIKDLNTMLSTESDIEQYKLLSVSEQPLDSRLRHLDVLCFPHLFPDGNFGEFHPRQVKLSNSEYIKSRLLNKDPRFRHDPNYVFFLMKQKEMREIKAGVYNLLKTQKSVAMSVSSLLQKVQANDDRLEENLSTMFQSVRGTKQYWNLRRKEIMCMLRHFGPQSLFVTFSCNEYESPDISDYLRNVNDVPENYSIPKLCTEDPISVSRQFAHKFHAFFQTMIVKGEVLGPVEHFYWKKEFQARGAPHYHILLWICGAPVIGIDDPDVVLS